MPTRIEPLFAALGSKHRVALIAYITAGDPTPERTPQRCSPSRSPVNNAALPGRTLPLIVTFASSGTTLTCENHGGLFWGVPGGFL